MSISSFSSSDRSTSSSSSSTAPSTRASLTSWDRYLHDLHTHTQTQAENDAYNRAIHINHLSRYYGHSDWTSVSALEDSDLSMHDFNEVLHGPRGGKYVLRQWVMFGDGERTFEVCRRGGRRVYASVEAGIKKGLAEDKRRREEEEAVEEAMEEARRADRGRGGRASGDVGRGEEGDADRARERRDTLAGSRFPVCRDELADTSLYRWSEQTGAEATIAQQLEDLMYY